MPIGIVAALDPRVWVTLRAYSSRIRVRYGTVRRWAHEGMPVLRVRLRGGSVPVVRVLPALADAWVRQTYPDTVAHARESLVYFARRVADGAIKIGFTSDEERRLSELCKWYGRHVMISTRPGDKPDELRLHARFAEHRIGETEWFRPAPEVLEEAHGVAGSARGPACAEVRAHEGSRGHAGLRHVPRVRPATDSGRATQGVR